MQNNLSTNIPFYEILQEYRTALNTAFPDQIEQLILFGSQARGTAHPDSDIDLLVIVGWLERSLPGDKYAHPRRDPRWRKIIQLAHDFLLRHDVVLSPLVMSYTRYQTPSPITAEIKRDGILVWSRN